MAVFRLDTWSGIDRKGLEVLGCAGANWTGYTTTGLTSAVRDCWLV